MKDLNAILSSWKGPLSYPNARGADDLLEERRKAAAVAAKAEAEQRRKEAEEAAAEAALTRVQRWVRGAEKVGSVAAINEVS